MEIIDIKLWNKSWQFDIVDGENTEDATFELVFETKKNFFMKPDKYKDQDYNRKPSRIEKTQGGYSVVFLHNVVALPCKLGIWRLQVKCGKECRFLKISNQVEEKSLTDSKHILYKIGMKVYVYPMIESNGIFCFGQMQENMSNAVMKNLIVKGYRTEASRLLLKTKLKETDDIRNLKIFCRDYEDNSGFEAEAELKEDGWITADFAEAKIENIANRHYLGIEYFKNGKYYYRYLTAKENQYHRRSGQGMISLPKQELTLIPCYGSIGQMFIHIVGIKDAEYYGMLYDAIAVNKIKLQKLDNYNQKLTLSIDTAKVGNADRAEAICIDRKNKILEKIPIDAKLLEKGSMNIDFTQFLKYQEYEKKTRRYVIYLKIWKEGKETYYRINNPDSKDQKEGLYDKMDQYFTPFEIGGAKLTEDSLYQISALPYMDKDMNCLRLVILPKESSYTKQQEGVIRNITVRHGKVKLFITIHNHGILPKNIFIKLRSTVVEKRYNMGIKLYRFFRKLIIIRAELDLSEVEFEQFYWDIAGEWEADGEVYDMILTNRRKILSRSLYLRHMEYNLKNGFFAYPYRKKSKEFALYYRLKTPYDSRWFIIKEYLALFCYYALKPYWDHKNIWIIYEKYCQMAQDNGYYFFKYCMEKLPVTEKRHIFYVIDKEAKDYQVVKPYQDHVVDFLSFQHMLYLVAARVLISSDTKAHAYAWHSANSVYRNQIYKKKNVFLQHGVMGFKCCHKGLRRGSANPSSLFIVSSEVEADIIEKYFEYNRTQIAITGLARWDVLKDKSTEEHKEILLMPTWRIWLEEVQKDEFVQSDYFKNYMAFLNMPKLSRLLEENDISLNFYIHPKFREYLDEFSTGSDKIHLIPFGTEPLNELIMRCSLMITDYSSASWDVYYQEKPVLFYLFDLELYNETQGSYFDMEKEAFGDSTKESQKLMEYMEYYIKNGFQEKEIYAKKREALLPYRDEMNSKRTYDIIKKKGW